MPALVDSTMDVAPKPAEKKPKMTKNQLRRAKKKEHKALERESRESSVATESLSEANEVRFTFNDQDWTCRVNAT